MQDMRQLHVYRYKVQYEERNGTGQRLSWTKNLQVLFEVHTMFIGNNVYNRSVAS